MKKIQSLFPLRRISILFLLLLHIATALLVTYTYLTVTDTLSHNRLWESTKTTLGKGVMGAYTFMYSPIALHEDRLNLGAWHGFQELIFRRALALREISFDCYLEEKSYLVFIFNKDETGFDGIRISTHPLFKNIYFTATPDGKFLKKKPVPGGPVTPGEWHQVEIVFSRDSFSLIIDNRLITQFAGTVKASQQIGFRGSLQNVTVDNVRAYGPKKTLLFQEDFSNRRAYILTFCIVFLGIGVFHLLFFGIRSLVRRDGGSSLKNRIKVSIILLGIAGSFYLFIYHVSTRYPRLTPALKAQEDYWMDSTSEYIRAAISKKYSMVPDDDFRILFLGSSQTWGAGAMDSDRTFVRITEANLNEHDDDVSYRCINGGISAIDTRELFYIYQKEWIQLDPKMVILNLSSNDSDPLLFYEYLEKLVLLNEAEHIRTVFSLEANSIEYQPGPLPLHAVMKEVARKYDVPIIDLHGYLLTHYDDGFLWWDRVHLAPYGHVLTGEFFADKIKKIVRKESIRLSHGK
ncbi:MAG: SGNH/GDSL hydrolase family protein [Candidatus Omnitrophica bacterium]|nr:SGNH/GDSL hydrolase family protein [Candidatus Omnitrophota bacterium]